MKYYYYKGYGYTIHELEKHKDCKVASHILRRNLWRHKLPVEEAMVKQIKSSRHRSTQTYFYNGLDMTSFELTELPECKVSYTLLRRLLRQGVPVEYALKNETPPEVTPGEEVVVEKRGLPEGYDRKAYGGCISFSEPTHRDDKSYTYEWLVSLRFGMPMDKNGINVQKSIDKILRW